MDSSAILSLVTALLADTSPFGIAQRARLEALLAEKPPIGGIIERLVAVLKTKAGFAYVNSDITSERCPTVVEPSLEGARLEEKLVGSRTHVLVELNRIGRRSATVAEGLLYGLTHPEELANGWIWCLDRVVVIAGREYMLVLYVDAGERRAYLCRVVSDVYVVDRVLSFPQRVHGHS